MTAILRLLLSSLIFTKLLAQPSTDGFTCPPNHASYPCQTFAFYRAKAPKFLDLASVGDLFSLSRLMISKPSNISSPSSPLVPNQPLFIPLSCYCNTVNSTTSISYANITYTIVKSDSFYVVSTSYFQNLTTYQSVEIVNPSLVPTNLEIGVEVVFPVFCKCPNLTGEINQTKYLISYVNQPGDTLPSIASFFEVDEQSIVDVNGDVILPFNTLFVPVKRLPQLKQPVVAASVSGGGDDRKGLVIGLGIGLGIAVILLILIIGCWGYRASTFKRDRRAARGTTESWTSFSERRPDVKNLEANLLADVSDCLDKYRMFKMDELRAGTDGFSANCLIRGSVYRGSVDGEVFAIKKMNWNASEELKILQKVNHGNLVKLEGFGIDPEDSNCYLVYEHVENGSLHSWLHGNERGTLNWKKRLRIAIDIANGLQYIHEHTMPRVVHKDIKSSSILLDRDMRAKISNFGLAKSGCNAMTRHIVGTQGYIAPEYLTDGVVSTKMDVFSFGVVLLELVSGREAIDGDGKLLWAEVSAVLEENDDETKTMLGWMDQILLNDSFSMDSLMNVMVVAGHCLHKDPSKRPCMVDIVYALSKSDDPFFDVSDDRLVVVPHVVAR